MREAEPLIWDSGQLAFLPGDASYPNSVDTQPPEGRKEGGLKTGGYSGQQDIT